MSLTVDDGSPVTTDYVWDVNPSLPVILDDGTFRYAYGLDLISQVDGSNNHTYFLYDGLGSTVALADTDGDVTDTYEYDVFGAVRASTGSSDNPWLFTGEQYDPDSELYYLRAREYDPATGRFLSVDPIGAGEPFAYVSNNPTNFIDPYGLLGLKDIKKAAHKVAGTAVDVAKSAAPYSLRSQTFLGPIPSLAISQLPDPGYVDLNVSLCPGVCVSFGGQASLSQGIHPYIGGGFGTPSLSANLTFAPGQSITTGWNCGYQISVGEVFNATTQYGMAGVYEGFSSWQALFFEVGGGIGVGLLPVNASATCVYIG